MNSNIKKFKPNPRENANVFSQFFYWWTRKLFKNSYKNHVTVDDLYDPLNIDRSEILGDALEKNWVEQRKTSTKNSSLLKTIFVTFKRHLIITMIYHAFSEVFLSILVPVLLGLLLPYFRFSPTMTFGEALFFGGLLVVGCLMKFLWQNHALFHAYYIGGRMRAAICSLVYRKALRLSKTALGETPPGQIVNLMANDINRVEFIWQYTNAIWSTPLTTIIISIILYFEDGYPPLAGVVVFFILIFIQAYIILLSSKYRRRAALCTDERVRFLDEIISGIQVIKMYAWEKPFESLIKHARRREIEIICKSSDFYSIFCNFNIISSRLALYCAISVMLFMGEIATPERVFTILPFYLTLADNVIYGAMGLVFFTENLISIDRIQSFMELDEFSNLHNNFKTRNVQLVADRFLKSTSPKNWSIKINNLTVKCLLKSPHNILEDVNLKFDKGKLYLLIGTVGSGKSSLLSAIMNELVVVRGNVETDGTLTYAGQDAWLFGGTVRQNILFGEPFDQLRYDQTVNACNLNSDFSQLPYGDQTVIREKGVSLSGGQKARINLARAVYRQADIVLLDDPLSAVDARVGKRIFKECIVTFLSNKTRILATHQLQYIKEVDGIVLVDESKVHYYNDYQELLMNYPEYVDSIALKETEDPDDKKIFTYSSESKLSLEEIESSTPNLTEDLEQSSKNQVNGNLLLAYFKSGSNVIWTLVMALLFVLAQGLMNFSDLFVLVYAKAEQAEAYPNETMQSSNFIINYLLEVEQSYSLSVNFYFYTVLIIVMFTITILRTYFYFVLCFQSSTNLHGNAFGSLVKTSLQFFHKNPSGRIMNCLSKDTSIVDEMLPRTLLEIVQTSLVYVGAITITTIINPAIIVPFVCIVIIGCWIRNIYVKNNTTVKYLEGITKAPVFTHLSETLNGISTIRACNAETMLIQEFDKLQDIHTSAWFTLLSCKLASSFLFRILNCILIFFVVYGFVIYKDYFDQGNIALVITQMISTTAMIAYVSVISVEVSHYLSSAERLLEYTRLPAEENVNALLSSNNSSFYSWPHEGRIKYKNVWLRYKKNGIPTLKNICFTIEPKEKIGIVGRTGSGKTSLINILFQLQKIDGHIKIDGIDIATVPLEILRSRISIIPQDPVLFSGTLRRNLDPLEEYSDSDIWDALEQVELKSILLKSNNDLDVQVLAKGANYSVGQRQLVCLARAILRKNRIIVLDEATANVDPQTDALIQRTIRTKFASCTILTIAHRLNTIIDSDKVVVMESGNLMECDHPYKLLQMKTGKFTQLVRETGEAIFQQLFEQAKKCYEEKYFG